MLAPILAEKNDIQEPGRLRSYTKMHVSSREQYSQLEDDLLELFDQEFPAISGRMLFATQELMKNAYEHNNQRLTLELEIRERAAYVLVTGAPHDPRAGQRTPEERGYDPNQKTDAWIMNGRSKEIPLCAPNAYSWGTMIANCNANFYGYTKDGTVKVIGFNLSTALSKAS